MLSKKAREAVLTRVASPADGIKDHYTVLVIGSGYGGAIAASRLARAGQQVCVLERGREFQAGEFPDSEAEALSETQADLPSGHTGSRTGLYDFRISPDVNVFVGCGLGGTSLINGNIAVRPDARVFEDARWPAALRGDLSGIEQGYRRAEEMLRPTPYPARYPALAKLLALEQSAAHLGRTCVRAPIAVNFEEGVNAAGIPQHACILCGDCISGCNYGAKNTTALNYLPDARRFGAEIYTQVSVRRLECRDGRWLAHYRTLETGFEDLDEGLRTVSADIVVLAAGTLGSTEILLRSKAAGLPLSDQVGKHFSGNGDALGFSFECAEEIRGVGYGRRDARDMEAVGPCVTGMIDMRDEPDVDQGIVIQDLATPGALAGLLPDALAQTGAALGRASGEGLGEALAMEADIESLTEGPYETNADRTQAYLVTTHERGAGAMRLENGRLEIEWPHVGEQSVFQKVNATLAEATDALGGKYLINPVWSAVFKRDLITLHPLGGCVMAGDAERGVVNHKGQVFAGARGTAVYDGLYVCDGSTIPRSLGVGPLLTVSALSERTCAWLAEDRGWRIDYSSPPAEAQVEAPGAGPMGIQFGELARGDGLELHLTVVSDDVDGLASDPAARARVAGSVRAPLVSREPLKVVKGEFSGMAAGRMIYSMTLSGHAGRMFYLEATKVATVLEATLYEGDSPAGRILMKTVLSISPGDFERQLGTLRVSGAPSQGERLRATTRFGQALAGDLYGVYGGMTEQRKKRPLRANAPSIYPLLAGGRLVRYEGGSRGPVLLVAGAGISAAVFTIDTVETSLVEFLFAHRYDVWLLDAPDGEGREAALRAVKNLSRAAHIRVWSCAHTSGAVELNAATRDAVPEEYRDIAILGSNAVNEVYPGILTGL